MRVSEPVLVENDRPDASHNLLDKPDTSVNPGIVFSSVKLTTPTIPRQEEVGTRANPEPSTLTETALRPPYGWIFVIFALRQTAPGTTKLHITRTRILLRGNQETAPPRRN
jgi:hypothetical protein